MRSLIAVVGIAAGLCGCGSPPRVAQSFGESPTSIAVCSFSSEAAFEVAQAHCRKDRANASLVGSVGQCDFGEGPGRQHTFLTATRPTLFNFRCEKP